MSRPINKYLRMLGASFIKMMLLLIVARRTVACNRDRDECWLFHGGTIKAEVGAHDQSDISPNCISAFEKLKTDMEKLVTVADSIGKPAAGLLEGNLAWIGHYDECTKIADYRYCTVQMKLNGTALKPGVVLPISWGVCAPKECNSTDVTNAIGVFTEIANMSEYFYPSDVIGAATLCSEDPPRPYDAGFICTVVFSFVMVILAIVSALYDAAHKIKCQKLNSPLLQFEVDEDSSGNSRRYMEDETSNETTPLCHSIDKLNRPIREVVPEEPGKQHIVLEILQCFSLTSNLSRLLNTKQSDRSITCLNGIRVISMFWVILGHTFSFSLVMGVVDNINVSSAYLQSLGFQAIANGTFSVDSFFFLSGVLVGFLTLSRMAKTDGKIPWFWFYFHRFWRLTPVYMFIILVYMYLMPQIGQGPFWQFLVVGADLYCVKYWWTNLLYINNFYPKILNETCLQWGWYLADDMQFFIVSPIFLISLFMFPVLGIIFLICALLASFIVTGTLIGYYDLTVFNNFQHLGISEGNVPPLDYQNVISSKPYCRIAPYLVGIALGYVMYKIGARKIKLNPIFAASVWGAAAVVALSVIYGVYPAIEGGYTPSLAANIVYGTVSRGTWAVVLAWVVFACKYGYGGWVNDFLSWNVWVVLSRLTFTAYLLHPIVLEILYFNFGTAVHISKVLFAFYFAGTLSITYSLAAVFFLVIECPFINLEKLFMPKDIQTNRKVV